jgi:LPXTG-site transpeptidase (sortase) family protein
MKKLTKFNKTLSIINIIVALYILLIPFFPALLFWVRQQTTEPPVIVSRSESKPSFPHDNRIIVPSILLDEKILEGPSAGTLNNGVWRRPSTSTPNTGSNTVLAGHVFTYDDPESVFYNLGKINNDDEIAVYWEGAEYIYKVTDIKEVPATALEIEAPTAQSQLTIYTCTPLWNPVNRLVVTANLQEVNKP